MGRQATGSLGGTSVNLFKLANTISAFTRGTQDAAFRNERDTLLAGTYASRGSDALAGFQKRATGGSSTQLDGSQRGPLVNRYNTKKEKKPGYSLAAASLDSCKQSPPPTSESPRVLDEFELSAVEPAAGC
jgi:hypothetical protein